ncbi:MAG: hypothetical protein MAG453_00733 [Calditrichaeota bacterium]|nr:hypothetical protein [Calditrichota bacterium]
MATISDRKYAEEMGLDVGQVRKLIKRLDIGFFSSGKGEGMVYMFDTEELNEKLQESKKSKKDRRRGPRKKRAASSQAKK